MTWNFHRYYSDKREGLIGKLTLTQEEKSSLVALRDQVRRRTRDTFEEAKTLCRETKANGPIMENAAQRVAESSFGNLASDAQDEIAALIVKMDDHVRDAFLSLKPRFWTQGSFQYDTLNTPYQTPPQEMDIDDGTYLPMAMFEDEPIIGHRFLQLIVDCSLQSLVEENRGWEFESKKTCARIKIQGANTHIDVPMYAIPEEQFQEKELALEALRTSANRSKLDFADVLVSNRAEFELDSSCVNLALREGEQKWMKSDPKVVDDWFKECCDRISHLRKFCRFMKAWRDAQWPRGGGPSSIALMAAIVNVLNRVAVEDNDFGSAMRTLSKHLAAEFERGVESPDPSDERPLFPDAANQGPDELYVVAKLRELEKTLADAESADSNDVALERLNGAFGRRVRNPELIVKTKSASAFQEKPEKAAKATTISTSMVSG